MKRYGLMLLLLVASLLVIASSAMAGDQKIADEGKMVIHATPLAMETAEDFNYQKIHSRQIGTEAGAEVVASPKAQLAAKLYSYDQPGAFAKMSDEAGTSYFAAEHQSSSVHNAIAKLNDQDLLCQTC